MKTIWVCLFAITAISPLGTAEVNRLRLMTFNILQGGGDAKNVGFGNELFGAKWRNWKILLKEMDDDGHGIKKMAYPSVYNLIVDPKEEVPELNYLNDTWVDFPLYQVIEDHLASIEQDPGAPNP